MQVSNGTPCFSAVLGIFSLSVDAARCALYPAASFPSASPENQMKLTQKNAPTLSLPEGKSDHIFWDEDAKGFGYRLRRGAGGKVLRSWVAQYRHDGQTRRMLLGSAEVVKADQARKLAKMALGQVANNKDPQADKKGRRSRDKTTFKSVAALYLEAKKREVRPRTHVELSRYLTDAMYFGSLHAKPLDKIKRADVAECVTDIGLKRTLIVAKRARVQLSAFFAWAVAQDLCEANPVIGTKQPLVDDEESDRVLSDIELARVWNACRDDEYGRIIRLLILTGCRRQEIGGMCWSEFDDPKNPSKWTLPKGRSKNNRAHTLPVLPMIQAVLDTVPKMASRDTLFGVKGGGFTGWSENKRMLDERLGPMAKWVAHDLRRSVASGMADLNVLPHIIEAVLNHQSGSKRGPAGVYNRSKYVTQTRAALETWHAHIANIVEGKVSNVIPMHQAAS
jgi:integrase